MKTLPDIETPFGDLPVGLKRAERPCLSKVTARRKNTRNKGDQAGGL